MPALALPGPAQPSTPANNAVVSTVTPVLTGAGQSGTGLTFEFLISATSDPTVNTLYTSPWLSSPSLTVPGNFLHDGATYSWKIGTKDASGTAWSTVATFKVNLRLGDQPANPWDSAGGVKVNLANGNLLYSVSSAQLQTAGGPLGVTFTYNSKQSPYVLALPLSQGWSLSVDTQGSLAYQQLVVDGNDLVLVAPDGSTEEYQRPDSSTAAWAPVDDGQAVVTQNSAGQFVVTGQDGLTYLFDSGGRLRYDLKLWIGHLFEGAAYLPR